MRFYDLSFREELDILKKYQITYEDLCLVKLLFYVKDDSKNFDMIAEYYGQCKKSAIKISELQFLKDSKILSADSHIPEIGEEINFKSLHFSTSFEKNFYKYSNQLGKDLWEKFPFYIITDRVNYPIKNFSKHFKNIKEIYTMYGKAIKHDLEYHNKVMQSLDFVIKNDLISCNIVDYVLGSQWEQHIRFMNGEESFGLVKFSNNELL